MLSDADLARIVAVVATKEDVAEIQEKFAELDEEYDWPHVLLDKLVGVNRR